MLLEVLLSLVAIYLVSYVIQTWLEIRKLPPGPIPLPIIGNLHQLGNNPPFSSAALCKKYPNVLRLKFPFGYCLFLNSAEAAREAFVTRKTDFAGRPIEQFYPINVILGERDIATTDFGPTFTFRSKVFKSALHLFGDQTKILEKRFHDMVSLIFARLDELVGENVNLKKVVESSTFALMWEWLSSERITYEDDKMKKILDFIDKCNFLGRQGSYYQLFPIMRHLPTKFKKCLNDVLKARDDLFGTVLDHHRATFQDGVVRDLTDAMILSYMNEENESKNISGSIDDVMFLMIDVMTAGSDSSVNVLKWCVLHLVLKNDVQNKIHDELDRCMENENMPNTLQLKKFHYLNAFLCEVFRSSTNLPIFPPHRTIRDTNVMGYNIPKHMTVFVNQYCINNDPLNWDDPKTFRPERFLDENGEFVGWNKHEAFMPFGMGRRGCPGKELGKLQVTMILACLLYRYHFTLAENQEVPKLNDPVVGATARPKDYLVTVLKRK